MKQQDRSTFVKLALVLCVVILALAGIVLMIENTRPPNAALNEERAITLLQSIFQAEEEFRDRALVDLDYDGEGEYGYLSELGGGPIRIVSSTANGTAYVARGAALDPPLIALSSHDLERARIEGFVVKNGYVFKLWLPSADVRDIDFVRARFGVSEGSTEAFPLPDSAETSFCCYAWPVEAGKTGNIAFFVNQQGVVLETENAGPGAYSGTGGGPDFDAAFTKPQDMAVPIQIPMSPRMKVEYEGNDGRVWSRAARPSV